LACANSGSGTLTVLTNNGSGHFGIAQSPAVGSYPIFVTAADANGDGKVDLITANSGDQTLTVLTNNGSGGFVLDTNIDISADGTPFSVVAADVDGDGVPDLISADNEGFVSVVLAAPTMLTNIVNGMVISWPTNAADGFGLQRNSNLNTTNWVNITTTPTVVNGTNQVSDPLTNTNRFYRLRHP
jgi:hypothetical protein